VAVVTGFYLLFLNSVATGLTSARLLFGGAIFLLVFPLCIPNILHAREWFKQIHSSFTFDGSGFILVDDDEDLGLYKESAACEGSYTSSTMSLLVKENGSIAHSFTCLNVENGETCCESVIGKNQLVTLGEEHPASLLVRRVDFWLYYFAYFCGGTLGLVYSNNLGQISQSLGQSSNTTALITLYSSFSFFGRLLSAAPDYMRA